MTYKVTLSSNNNINVKISAAPKVKITPIYGGIQVPSSFEDLLDFDDTNKNDKYVIMYDDTIKKYKMVNPDEVLSAATIEPIQPGLPQDFENQLDIDLDNKIDLDAGTF